MTTSTPPLTRAHVRRPQQGGERNQLRPGHIDGRERRGDATSCTWTLAGALR
jgi:hypothetical protein